MIGATYDVRMPARHVRRPSEYRVPLLRERRRLRERARPRSSSTTMACPDTAPEFADAAKLDAHTSRRDRSCASKRQAMKRAELARMIDHSVLEARVDGAGHRRRRRGRARLARRLLLRAAVLGVASPRGRSRGDRRHGRSRSSAFRMAATRPDVKARATRARDRRRRRARSTPSCTSVRCAAAKARTSSPPTSRAVVRAAQDVPVKVILETAALTDAQKRLACRLAVDAGAAFVKTSTGFHPSGRRDRRRRPPHARGRSGRTVGVKASGGIRTLADAQAMIDAGANRIGASATVAILSALV